MARLECAPGGTRGSQTDPAKACRWEGGEAIRLPSNSTPSPPPGAGRQSAGKLNLNGSASSCRGGEKERLLNGKPIWAPSSSRLRDLSAYYLKLSGCGPGHASTPNVTSPTSGPQRVSGPWSRVPVSSALGIPRPVRLSRSGRSCAWRARPEAEPRERHFHPD